MVVEATITEISAMDLPNDLQEGSAQKRRQLVAIRYTSSAVDNTITLATHLPGVADVEGVVWDSIDSAITAASITWSTTTITTAGHAGSGIGELGVVVNLT